MSHAAIFQSEHNLEFEVAPWGADGLINKEADDVRLARFRVGTCEGLWSNTGNSYSILSIDNHQKGNGHLRDVMQWFANSCLRDGRDFEVLQIMNSRFKAHLIRKYSFRENGGTVNLVLKFKDIRKEKFGL